MVGGLDGRIDLPQAPLPRPAARQAAIELALLRFDGLEPPATQDFPNKRSSVWGWATRHQRAAGAFATAALVLTVTVPLGIQTIEQGRPSKPPAEVGSSEPPSLAVADTASEESADLIVPEDTAVGQVEQVKANELKQGPLATREVPALRTNRRASTSEDPGQVSQAPPALALAPAAPAPQPPIARAEQDEHSVELAENVRADEVVVTGSRIRPLPTSKSTRSAGQSSPFMVVEQSEVSLSDLRTALRTGNRRQVLRLTGLPLRVNYADGAETYRTVKNVQQDFERIFTPAVRASLEGGTSDLALAADGTTRVGRITIGHHCFRNECGSKLTFRILAVTP